MNKCEKLIAGCIAADCVNPVFTGMDSLAYIFNKKDITFGDPTTADPNVFTSITMRTYTPEGGTDPVTTVGYTIDQLGKQPYTGTNTAMVEGNVSNKFTETLNFVVPDNSPAAAMLLDNIANGKFVVIVKNEYKGSDGRAEFQVYGGKKGLVATAMEREAYSEDTDGGWAVTLTAENTPNSAMFIEHKTGNTVDTESYLLTFVDTCQPEQGSGN